MLLKCHIPIFHNNIILSMNQQLINFTSSSAHSFFKFIKCDVSTQLFLGELTWHSFVAHLVKSVKSLTQHFCGTDDVQFCVCERCWFIYSIISVNELDKSYQNTCQCKALWFHSITEHIFQNVFISKQLERRTYDLLQDWWIKLH